MQEEIEVFDEPGVREQDPLAGALEVKNLTFAYDQQEVLKNVSFSLKPGETLGIVGKTGSGKTTLVNLLLRLYSPPKGSILVDGHDVMDLPLKQLREVFAYVPQDNFLFSDTIAENIAFGTEDKNDEAIVQAAKWADVHKNIVEFNKGYKTIVGERGVTLSGGQKQRVSIARALILGRPIMILDDAVSAVDTKTEEAILETLKSREQQQTTLIIAHRISTLQHADQIIVLEDGAIVERGNHDDLLALDGVYADMVNKQQLEEEILEGGQA